MTDDAATRLPPLAWSEAIAEIPEKGLRRHRSATAEECHAVATELDIVSCERIDADYRIVARGPKSFALEG